MKLVGADYERTPCPKCNTTGSHAMPDVPRERILDCNPGSGERAEAMSKLQRLLSWLWESPAGTLLLLVAVVYGVGGLIAMIWR